MAIRSLEEFRQEGRYLRLKRKELSHPLGMYEQC